MSETHLTVQDLIHELTADYVDMTAVPVIFDGEDWRYIIDVRVTSLATELELSQEIRPLPSH